MNEDQIIRTMSNVKTTLAVEGLTASTETEELRKRYLKGEITGKEAITL